MSLRTCYKIEIALVLAGVLLIVAGFGTDILLLVLVGILLTAVALVLDLKYYCCPHCGRLLDRLNPWWGGNFCPRCGKEIDWDQKVNRK